MSKTFDQIVDWLFAVGGEWHDPPPHAIEAKACTAKTYIWLTDWGVAGTSSSRLIRGIVNVLANAANTSPEICASLSIEQVFAKTNLPMDLISSSRRSGTVEIWRLICDLIKTEV